MRWLNPTHWIRRMECWMHGHGPWMERLVRWEGKPYKGKPIIECLHCGIRVSPDTQLQKSGRD